MAQLDVLVESNALEQFAVRMPPEPGEIESGRLKLDPDGIKNGVAQLVLSLVKLLHELLERQAIRRMEAGSLSGEQIERLGVSLMNQAEQIDHLREAFGLSDDDLNLDLGPLGRLL